MPLDPKAQELLAARAKLLPKTGTVPAHVMRQLHRELLAKAPPGPGIYLVKNTECPSVHGAIPVRIYQPSPSPRALVVYFHGGGWTVGSLDGWDTALRRLANQADCLIVSVDYRLAPEHRFPAAHDDALTAARWCATQRQWVGSAELPLVLAGDSAGANLAAHVSRAFCDEGGPQVAAQVLLYPSTDGDIDSERLTRFVPPSLTRDEIAWYFDQYVPEPEQRRDPRFAPLLVEQLAGLPPTFVGTVEDDLLRAEAELYASRLEQQGVTVQTRMYRGTFHGFFTADRGQMPQSGQAIADITDFIQRHAYERT